MSDKPAKKKTGKKPKKKISGTSSPKTPKSRKSSEPSSPKPLDSEPVPKFDFPLKMCLLHKKKLDFYCDNREELICEDCLGDPLYSRYPSRVLKIEEAFRIRMSGLYNALNSYVLPKKYQIDFQKLRLQTCMNELKGRKYEIESDIKGEFSAMNERLNFSYGSKQAVLLHDLKELQVDLDRIDHTIYIIESSSRDQISFLQRSADVRNLLELSASKPFKSSISVDYRDLPKELNKVRDIVFDFPVSKRLVAIKDEIIWKIVNHKPNQTDATESAKLRIAELARLAEKYKQELKKFHLSCEHCGNQLNENTVNANCTESKDSNGRHFFSPS
jgi:NUMB domain